jgi:hypothetical protein
MIKTEKVAGRVLYKVVHILRKFIYQETALIQQNMPQAILQTLFYRVDNWCKGTAYVRIFSYT